MKFELKRYEKYVTVGKNDELLIIYFGGWLSGDSSITELLYEYSNVREAMQSHTKDRFIELMKNYFNI